MATSVQLLAETMQEDLRKLVASAPEASRAAFQNEMDDFYALFLRFLEEESHKTELVWDDVRSPGAEQILLYNELKMPGTDVEAKALLDKLVVLKLNGGLGTTMGCVGPKSAIEVRSGMTFLDLTVKQIEHLNVKYDCDVPLVLMNSFNTDTDTEKIVHKYKHGRVHIKMFNQSRYPRFKKEGYSAVPSKHDSDKKEWFPPGHGDLYDSLYRSGLLEELLAQGKEYIFVSNVDNLGATVDLAILDYVKSSNTEFLMEVTDKTRADVKGGTLVDYKGSVRLLEIAQVPPQHVEDFKSISKFSIFNTNNLWVSLPAIKRVVESKSLKLEIIVNPKSVGGEKVIQLETAVGAAIKHFPSGRGLNVPRSRFLPVKGTSDLFLVQSNLYTLNNGQLQLNEKRVFPSVPLVKLGTEFSKVSEFLSRFSKIPNILELDHLTVTGDVMFGSDVTLKGTVIIVSNHGSRIDIPPGTVLENKIVSGNLRILDH